LVVVLISGRGSNMQALVEAGLPVSAVISNRAQAEGLRIAAARGMGVLKANLLSIQALSLVFQHIQQLHQSNTHPDGEELNQGFSQGRFLVQLRDEVGAGDVDKPSAGKRQHDAGEIRDDRTEPQRNHGAEHARTKIDAYDFSPNLSKDSGSR